MLQPLVIDLFCGLGGWSEGFLSAGYNVVGFDIEQHVYGEAHYPAQLVLQNVLTIHGSQFRNAACIVASPPCQEFSYMAMPWTRAKQIGKALRGDGEFPDGYAGSRTLAQLTALFDACFRIQREACAAAGRYIPMVVENVKGAQPWVGRASANFGSFYLWGDVAMVGGRIVRPDAGFRADFTRAFRGRKNDESGWRENGTLVSCNRMVPNSIRKLDGLPELNGHDDPRRGRINENGSWFGIGSNGKPNKRVDGLKNPGMTSWSDHGKPGYKPQGFNVTAAQRYREGTKHGGDCFNDPNWPGKQGGVKQGGSKSDSRKAASAQIAKIPFDLAEWVARSFLPA